MKKCRLILLLVAAAVALPGYGEEMPHTDRTRGLIRELLTKLDSTDIYAARKEKSIEELKVRLNECPQDEKFSLCNAIAGKYSNFIVDSALVYIAMEEQFAREMGSNSLVIDSRLRRSNTLSMGGFYVEAGETLESIPRNELDGKSLVQYYNARALFYHELYSATNEPADFREKYRSKYNVYRDSLLAVADTTDHLYLRNMEKKADRAGDFDEARRYNAIRFSRISDTRSGAYAACLYDRFMTAFYYEGKLTGEAVDDLLESAIIEVEICNRNIASLLRVEALLININEVKAAKKVSDYYYSSLRLFGSRKRLLEGGEQAINIMDKNQQLLQARNKELLVALALISLMVVAMVFLLVVTISSRGKIARLNEDLQRSGKISKNYVGVVFQLYSSYIKRLDVFRTKIHSSLRKGNIDQALELTMPSGDISAEERKELFYNFDTAFVDIFPDFIETVNGCLKPEERIVPKKTEILSTELRILALIKLGIEDSTQIAEMLHCSVKTVYNLRSVLKSRLAVSEDEFQRIISEL
ncbi:MAG: hypothetical protein IKP46_05185 [Bacteroidales bacterium]|nr:hypothetical protein [Bacteroidales bacterium]